MEVIEKYHLILRLSIYPCFFSPLPTRPTQAESPEALLILSGIWSVLRDSSKSRQEEIKGSREQSRTVPYRVLDMLDMLFDQGIPIGGEPFHPFIS
jgi:hypothetical protein